MKNMPCCKKSPGILLQRLEGDFAVYECEHPNEEVGTGNGHRHLAQDGTQRRSMLDES